MDILTGHTNIADNIWEFFFRSFFAGGTTDRIENLANSSDINAP